ncbi:MAG: hypothetical protein GC192_07180 [Bacteroidetes bacterium]|nr:hypothetical protein [Bacteroidota bacterium]
MKNALTLLLFLLLLVKTQAQTVTLTPFASGFNWLVGIARAPGENRMYVYQKDGFIKILNTDGTVQATPFLDLSAKVQNDGERGLVGLAFHPQYQSNGFFYVFYNQVGTGKCTVSRFKRSPGNPNIADPTEGILLSFDHPELNHVGGCMKFGPDGYLYISTGDGGGAGDPNGNGQNLLSFLGKILRIDVGNQGGAYTVPASNPFVGVANTAPEIWAYGLRNPWRFSFDRWSGNLWIGDVGQDTWEEVNMQPSNSTGGENYGWSCKEGLSDFNSNQCFGGSLTDPLYQYGHISTPIQGWCAGSITGGVVYRGTQFADLQGKYIFADFCTGKIFSLAQMGIDVQVEEAGDFNDVDFSVLDENNAGELFVCAVNSNQIYQLKSTDCTPVAWLVADPIIDLPFGASAQLNAYGNNMNYQWLLNGDPINGANGSSLEVTTSGTYSFIVTNPANGCTNTSNETVVTAPPPLSVTLEVDDVNCFGETSGAVTAVAAGGSSNYTYLWNTGDTSASISNVPAGTYVVGVSDGNSSVTAEALVAQPSDLSLNFNGVYPSMLTSEDGIIWAIPSGGTPPYQYMWSTGATTDTIFTVQFNHTYSVTITDENGCSTSDETAFIIWDANEVSDRIGLQLMPNPVVDDLTLQFQLSNSCELGIFLTDAIGRRLVSVLPYCPQPAGNTTLRVSMKQKPAGLYYLVVNLDGQIAAKKILKR